MTAMTVASATPRAGRTGRPLSIILQAILERLKDIKKQAIKAIKLRRIM